MTGPAQFPPRARPERRDRLIQERVHDPYRVRGKLPEPTACEDCGAVYHAGRWQWLARPDDAHSVICPACRRIRDRQPAGYITLDGAFAATHREEIMNLMRSQAEGERLEHPLERLMGMTEGKGRLIVTTTDLHLARRLGEALQRAYKGHATFKYGDHGAMLRVNWTRD